jgi:hypothetical protein
VPAVAYANNLSAVSSCSPPHNSPRNESERS